MFGILNRHIARNMLVSMLLALGILTFVMLSGQLFKVLDFLSRGVSPVLFGKYILYMLPDLLRFTLPLSMLVAVVLVFSRMSADNEIVAMKTSGISLWQIVTPGIVLSFCLCVICAWLSLFVSPLFRYRAEQLRWEGLESYVAMLEPGRFVSIPPNFKVRIGERQGDQLRDVHVYMLDNKGNEVKDITAAVGYVRIQGEEQQLSLNLRDVTVSELTMNDGRTETRHWHLGQLELELGIGGNQKRSATARKVKYMDLRLLCAQILLEQEEGRDTAAFLLELHRRLSMAMSPFSFLLLGLPFGIRSRRSEKSVGLLICVLLALGFYAFLQAADMLKRHAGLHPEYIIWLPNALYQSVGLWIMHRIGKH